MNVKKAIKRIVALGSGLAMIGATIMGATALNLGDYPAPFVQNGAFNGKIVIGAAANPADVLGAIDISASLQAASKTAVDVAGSTATTTINGGVLLEDSSNQDLNFPDLLSTSAFDDQDFPNLLADGTLEDDDGTDYSFTQEITLDGHSGQALGFGLDSTQDNVYDEPILYLNLKGTSSFINFTVDFSGDEVNWVNLDDSETIKMFGTDWTVKNMASGDDLVLYGSDVSQIVSLNSPVDVESDGKTYTLNVIGANSDDHSVQVSVNGNVKSMAKGESKTLDGLKVYVEDVFISNIAGESASAKLFIGSKEINLGHDFSANNLADVELDSETMDGVQVHLEGSDTAVSKIEFVIDPTSLNNPETNEDYDWIALGDSFTDPLFGFKVNFVESVPSLMDSSRDYVDLKSSNDDFEITYTNHKGVEYTFSPYQWDGSKFIAGNDWVDSGTTVNKNEEFILFEDSSSSEPVSKVFKFKGTTDSDTKAEFEDLGSGATYTVSNTSTLAKTGVTVTTGNDVITLGSAVKNSVYTDSGMLVEFPAASGTATPFNLTFTEDKQGTNKDEVTGDVFYAQVSYDSTDKEFNIAKPTSWSGEIADDNSGDHYYGVSDYGTYYVYDADQNTELELYVPPEDVDYRVFLAPSDASTVTSGGSSDGTYYNVNPLAVGIALLDTDAPAVGSTPMIVVGGPCANTVAAELMGNPAVCSEGFEAGKAVIKYFDDKQAVLVAGYEAMETQGASRVLADYADYSLGGNEVEVVVPSLQSITINQVA